MSLASFFLQRPSMVFSNNFGVPPEWCAIRVQVLWWSVPSFLSVGFWSARVMGKMYHWCALRVHSERIQQSRKTRLEYCYPRGARMASEEGKEGAWSMRHDVFRSVPPQPPLHHGFWLHSVPQFSSLHVSPFLSKNSLHFHVVCMCVWQSEDSLWDLVLSLYHVDSGVWQQWAGWHQASLPTEPHLQP